MQRIVNVKVIRKCVIKYFFECSKLGSKLERWACVSLLSGISVIDYQIHDRMILRSFYHFFRLFYSSLGL